MSRKNREIAPAFLSVSKTYFVLELSAATAFKAEPPKIATCNAN
jgi:hypothetical protein